MTLLNRLLPLELPLVAMKFTRQPVMPRFWTGGLLAMLGGFAIGFLLWMQQQGILPQGGDFLEWRLIHVRLQLFLFAGSFLLGFAMQAGPHVMAGTPPESRTALWVLYPLWLGFCLTLLPHPVAVLAGTAALSMGHLFGAGLILRMALGGDRQRLTGIGLPMAMGFLFLAAGPWAPVGDHGHALWVIWCGPMAIVFGASQQLISNVMNGQRLAGWTGHLFFGVLSLSWLVTGGAVLRPDLYFWVGVSWLVVWGWFVWHTRLVSALGQQGVTSLAVTLVVGLLFVPTAAVLLMLQGATGLDTTIHLLGAGTLTVLILGVAARVVGFFSAGRLFHDRILALLILAWALVAMGRALGLPHAAALTVLGTFLLAVWGGRLLVRLWAIRQLVPRSLGGQKADL